MRKQGLSFITSTSRNLARPSPHHRPRLRLGEPSLGLFGVAEVGLAWITLPVSQERNSRREAAAWFPGKDHPIITTTRLSLLSAPPHRNTWPGHALRWLTWRRSSLVESGLQATDIVSHRFGCRHAKYPFLGPMGCCFHPFVKSAVFALSSFGSVACDFPSQRYSAT